MRPPGDQQQSLIKSKSCVSVKRSAGRSDDKWERGESDAVDEIEEEEEFFSCYLPSL